MSIASTLQAVPAAVWTGLFTLTAVWLTLHSGRKRQALEHEMMLRRDVYMKATEAITSSLYTFLRMADLDVSDSELNEGYARGIAERAKLDLVASDAAIRAYLLFTRQLGIKQTRLTIKRIALVQRQECIKSIAKQMEACAIRRNALADRANQLHLQKDADDNELNATGDALAGAMEQCAELGNRCDLLQKQQYHESIGFLRECMEGLVDLSELLIPAVAAARTDLNLPFNESEYRRLSEETVHILRTECENAIATIDKMAETQ